MPGETHEVLVGTLLGGACIEKNGRFWRVRIDHGAKERAYVLWKDDRLRDLAASPPREVRVADPRTGRTYVHHRFDTRSTEALGTYRDLFYRDGRKVVPADVETLLKSPLTLAVWYMDDGHRRTDCRALRINTQSYDPEGVRRLVSALQRNFGVESKPHRVAKNQFGHLRRGRERGALLRGHPSPCASFDGVQDPLTL